MASSRHSFRFGLSELLLIVFVVFSGVMLAFHSGGFVINFQSLGFTVLSSVQKGVSAVANGVGDTFNAVHELARLREENRELTFMSKNLRISDAMIIGKTERQHLKLTFDLGRTKWPAMFWGGAESLGRDFDKGDTVDLLYQVSRNTFNGVETPQLIITDIRKSF